MMIDQLHEYDDFRGFDLSNAKALVTVSETNLRMAPQCLLGGRLNVTYLTIS